MPIQSEQVSVIHIAQKSTRQMAPLQQTTQHSTAQRSAAPRFVSFLSAMPVDSRVWLQSIPTRWTHTQRERERDCQEPLYTHSLLNRSRRCRRPLLPKCGPNGCFLPVGPFAATPGCGLPLRAMAGLWVFFQCLFPTKKRCPLCRAQRTTTTRPRFVAQRNERPASPHPKQRGVCPCCHFGAIALLHVSWG